MKGSIVLDKYRIIKHSGVSALISESNSSVIIKIPSDKGKQNNISAKMVFLSVLSYKTLGVVE